MKQYPYAKAEGAVRWVSTEWLGAHLEKEQVMIIDCQPNVHEYIKEHIPGARYVSEGIFRAHSLLPTSSDPSGCSAGHIAGCRPEERCAGGRVLQPGTTDRLR